MENVVLPRDLGAAAGRWVHARSGGFVCASSLTAKRRSGSFLSQSARVPFLKKWCTVFNEDPCNQDTCIPGMLPREPIYPNDRE